MKEGGAASVRQFSHLSAIAFSWAGGKKITKKIIFFAISFLKVTATATFNCKTLRILFT